MKIGTQISVKTFDQKWIGRRQFKDQLGLPIWLQSIISMTILKIRGKFTNFMKAYIFIQLIHCCEGVHILHIF